VQFDGIYADNIYCLQLAKDFDLQVFAGLGLNLYNTKSITSINNLKYIMPSVELSVPELKQFNNPFVFAYGYIPLMHLTHCPSQLNEGSTCAKCNYKKPLVYEDKNGFKFSIQQYKASKCYFTLYNSVITDISKKLDKIPFNYYLNMVQLSLGEVEKVISGFLSKEPLDTKNFTYGHLFRGAK
jgi:hypothetical protein